MRTNEYKCVHLRTFIPTPSPEPLGIIPYVVVDLRFETPEGRAPQHEGCGRDQYLPLGSFFSRSGLRPSSPLALSRVHKVNIAMAETKSSLSSHTQPPGRETHAQGAGHG